MTFEIDLGKLTDWIGIAVNALIFLSGLFVLRASLKSVQAVLRQLQSQATQQAYEAHKTAYMPLIQDPKLAKMMWGADADEYRINLLSSILVNQSSRVFEETVKGNIPHQTLETFRLDLMDLLSWPVIRRRWAQIRQFHHPDFVKLADECLVEIDAAEAHTRAAAAHLPSLSVEVVHVGRVSTAARLRTSA